MQTRRAAQGCAPFSVEARRVVICDAMHLKRAAARNAPKQQLSVAFL
jgi:hypothetical protein